MDFDPRDFDSHDEERFSVDRDRGRDDQRSTELDRDARERDFDPREVFARDLNLPRGLEREIVRDRDREYTLRGSSTPLANLTAVIVGRCRPASRSSV